MSLKSRWFNIDWWLKKGLQNWTTSNTTDTMMLRRRDRLNSYGQRHRLFATYYLIIIVTYCPKLILNTRSEFMSCTWFRFIENWGSFCRRLIDGLASCCCSVFIFDSLQHGHHEWRLIIFTMEVERSSDTMTMHKLTLYGECRDHPGFLRLVSIRIVGTRFLQRIPKVFPTLFGSARR